MVDLFDIHRFHFKSRVAERLGLEVTDEDYEDILYQIRHCGTKFQGKAKKGRTKHRIRLNGTLVDLIYDRKEKSIVTVLFPED